MKYKTGVPITIAGLLSIALVAGAQEIYRYVDKSGMVIYSDTPPDGAKAAERVELPAGPSEQSVKLTEERNRSIQKAVKRINQKHAERQRQQNEDIRLAEQELADAEANLEDAQQIKNDDRQSLAGGRRRITPAYFERLRKAQQRVEQATKKLREARGVIDANIFSRWCGKGPAVGLASSGAGLRGGRGNAASPAGAGIPAGR